MGPRLDPLAPAHGLAERLSVPLRPVLPERVLLKVDCFGCDALEALAARIAQRLLPKDDRNVDAGDSR